MKKIMMTPEMQVRVLSTQNIITSSLNIGNTIEDDEELESDAPTRTYGAYNKNVPFRN